METTVPNLRDLGGILTGRGDSLKHGALLRSGVPIESDVVDGGVVWPPSTVIDLRSAFEQHAVHPLSRHGATVHEVPLLAALQPGQAPPDHLTGLYALMLSESTERLIGIVDLVARSSGPTLLHCSAGKDRTGISVALVLRLLDVDREAVVADYLRSSEHTDEIEARFRLLLGPNRAQLPPSYFTVVPEAINHVLDTWEDHPGGVEGWYLSHGGRRVTIETMRAALLS